MGHWVAMLLLIFRQSRRHSIMRTVTLAVTILYFHWSSSVSQETSGRTTSAESSRNLSSLRCPGHDDHSDYASDESRGNNDNRETVTQFFTSSSNNSVIKVMDALKVHNLPNNKRRSNGSSHIKLEFKTCTNRTVRYHLVDSDSTIDWSFSPEGFANISLGTNTCFCALNLSVPQGMVAVVQVIKIVTYGEKDVITLMDDAQETFFNGRLTDLPDMFVTYSHRVTFNVTFVMVDLSSGLHMVIHITKLPQFSRPKFVITFNSSTSGKIEMRNRTNRDIVPFVKSSLHLKAPDDHIIVLHFIVHHSLCDRGKGDYVGDHVTFRTDSNTLTYELCKSRENTCNALAFYSGWVFVEFRGYQNSAKTSFAITFEFHHMSQPPAELSGDRWNCSATNWPELSHDSPCIFMFDCNDKEAEGGCWRGDGTFRQGIFQVDGTCIAILTVHEELTWNTENKWCQERGGQLVSLSTRNMKDRLPALLPRINLKKQFFIGLTSMLHVVSPMYKNSLQWSDKTVAHATKEMYITGRNYCFRFDRLDEYSLFDLCVANCQVSYDSIYRSCQLPGIFRQHRDVPVPVISTRQPAGRLSLGAYIRCPENHFTHVFLACDEASACWSTKDGSTSSCSAPLMSLPPFFKCRDVKTSVPYTLVCDHRYDCTDGSDEDFCFFPPCDFTTSVVCSFKKCLDRGNVCDNQVDCDDHTDEDMCYKDNSRNNKKIFLIDFVSSNATLDFRDGLLILNNNDKSRIPTFSCSDFDFTCTSLQQVCLPVYLRCNGLYDCPGHEDEAACDRYTCPGFYRCRKSQVCVHGFHVCDGVYHCPQRDDEMLCYGKRCPQNCVCHGWAFICFDIFHAATYSDLRYLDASGTPMTLAHLWNNSFLVHLSLVRCNLTKLHEVVLPNLRYLDLSNNMLTEISSRHFSGLTNMEFLKISNNPLKHFHFHEFIHTNPLKVFDMSHVQIAEVDFEIMSFFSNLATLNLSGSHIKYVIGQGFPRMSNLHELDLRQCPIQHFPKGIFQALHRLDTVFADNYKLCCPVTLPQGFNVLNCHAPSNEVSSCDDLLRSNLYRVALAIFASLALLGNVGTLVYRLIFHNTTGNVGYDVFVTNLCVADFLMGVYLLIIGIADHRYRGVYVWEDDGWKNSGLCKLTGVVCLLSMEVSVFIIFLITTDRFLVLRFPFSSFHFGKRSAQLTCGLVWLTGLTLAVTPCLPMTSHWQFYSQTSICIPLPTSRVDFPGRKYSFIVIVVLNFICFLLIFVGQVLIYWSIRKNSMSVSSTSKVTKDSTVARRLITVVMSDFVCWFPVGLTGILASYEVPIPGEVNVGMAIFILPVNSALNPFLYTLNIYMERRRRAREEIRQKRIICQLKFAKDLPQADI